MVDRLTELMRAEADVLDVPRPPTAAILQGGRRARRTHYLAPALVAAAAAALVGAMVVIPNLSNSANDGTATVHERQDASLTDSEAAAAGEAYTQSGAFAAGAQVFFGDFAKGVAIDDPAVRGLYYTSAGVLIRHGKDYTMDGGSGDNYSLVGTNGSVTGLDTALGDVSPATDPTQPYLAYARPGSESDWEVVILDLRTGGATAVVRVDGNFTWGGWDAPPVALSGDTVYVGLDDNITAVDWRTGDTVPTDLPGSTYPDVNANRLLTIQTEADTEADTESAFVTSTITVRDASTGDVLLSLPDEGDRWASLAPDGKQLLVYPYLTVDERGHIGPVANAVLYNIDTGDSTPVDPSPEGGYGWTPTGSIFSVNHDQLTVCTITGCSTTRLAIDPSGEGTIRLGGIVNES